MGPKHNIVVNSDVIQSAGDTLLLLIYLSFDLMKAELKFNKSNKQ